MKKKILRKSCDTEKSGFVLSVSKIPPQAAWSCLGPDDDKAGLPTKPVRSPRLALSPLG